MTEKLDMTKDDLAALNLSEEQEDLPGMLRELYDFVENYHEPIFLRHSNAMRFKQGDQWRYPRPPGFAMIVLNHLGPHVDIIASNLTEGEWLWQVSPRHAGVDDVVKLWNSLLDQAAMQDSMTTRNFGLVEQAITKGYGMVKLSHDPDRQIPTHYEVLTPYEYMGEPGVKRPDIDGALHIHTAKMTAKQVRAIWPDDWKKPTYATEQEIDEPLKYIVIDESGGAKDNTHCTIVREFWIKDDRMEPIPDELTAAQIEHEHKMFNSSRPIYPMLQENHQAHMNGHEEYLMNVRAEIEQQVAEIDAQVGEGGGGMGGPMGAGGPMGMGMGMGEGGGESPEADVDQIFNNDPRVIMARTHIKRHEDLLPKNPDAERSKYNGWRHIIAAGPDYTILHNGATPYKDSLGRGKVHFYALPCIDSATDYFGLSIVEKAMEPQEVLNLGYSKIHDHLTHVATGVIMDSTGLNMPPNQIRAAPGGILLTRRKPSDVVSAMPRDAIDPANMMMLGIARDQISLTTGVSEIHGGAYPPMERASEPMISKIAHLTEARWRAYHRQYADFLKRVGAGMLQIIQQFMTEQTQVRVAQGFNTEYEIVNRALMSPDGTVSFANELSVGEFDVEAQLKPMASLTDEAKTELAIKLYTLGTPGGDTLLDEQGFAEMVPDPALRESAIRKMKAKQAAQEQEAKITKKYMDGELTDNQVAVLRGGAPKVRSGGGRMRPNPKAKAGYGKS